MNHGQLMIHAQWLNFQIYHPEANTDNYLFKITIKYKINKWYKTKVYETNLPL